LTEEYAVNNKDRQNQEEDDVDDINEASNSSSALDLSNGLILSPRSPIPIILSPRSPIPN